MTANTAIQLLVVDDDRNHREMLRALLEEWGYDPVTVDNGEEAVAMCQGRAITEASGRITPDTAAAVAETGVDQIAVGWVTHSARVLDIGLDA